MLMAVRQAETSTLELFKLALEMAERRDALDSVSIADYFRSLLMRARALAGGSPDAVAFSPDAIELALALRQNPELADNLRGISSLEELSPERAAHALRSMEMLVAA